MRPSLKTASQRNQKKTFLVTQSTNPALSLDFLLGKIINELHEAQLNEEVNTKEDAINFIKNLNI